MASHDINQVITLEQKERRIDSLVFEKKGGKGKGSIEIHTDIPMHVAQKLREYDITAEVSDGKVPHVEMTANLGIVLAVLEKIGVSYNTVTRISEAEGVTVDSKEMEKVSHLKAANKFFDSGEAGLYLVSGNKKYPQGRPLICCAEHNDAIALRTPLTKIMGSTISDQPMEAGYFMETAQIDTLKKAGVRLPIPLPATDRADAHYQQVESARYSGR